MLLVLGMSFFAAGVVTEESRFSAKGASANMTCLTLGSIALALPTIYNCMPDWDAWKSGVLMVWGS